MNDGDKYLQTLTKDGQIERLCVAGCDPAIQKKMYRDAFEQSGFDRSKYLGVDIRNMTTEQAVEAIKNMIKNS